MIRFVSRLLVVLSAFFSGAAVSVWLAFRLAKNLGL